MKHKERSMQKMDEDLKGVYQQLQEQKGQTDVYFHLQDGLLDKMGKLCVPKEERIQLIRERRTEPKGKNNQYLKEYGFYLREKEKYTIRY